MKGIPRQAVLKPSHAVYRLQNQHFALGDRVTMVQDSGGVPLSVKGVVIGLNAKSMDVVWDVAFMSGITLGDRLVSFGQVTIHINERVTQLLSISWIDRRIQFLFKLVQSTIRLIYKSEGTAGTCTQYSVQATVRPSSSSPAVAWPSPSVRFPTSSSQVCLLMIINCTFTDSISVNLRPFIL